MHLRSFLRAFGLFMPGIVYRLITALHCSTLSQGAPSVLTMHVKIKRTNSRTARM